MKRYATLCWVSFTCLSLLCQAQEPQKPGLRSFGNAEWEATYHHKQALIPSTEGSPHLLSRILVTRFDDTKREILHWDNGKKTERWLYRHMLLYQVSPADNATIILDEAPEGKDLIARDFPDLSWTLHTLAKREESKFGKRCWYYEEELDPSNARLADESRRSNRRRAWVDVDTGLPVAAENDQYSVEYRFLTLAPPPLALGSEFEKRIRATIEVEENEQRRVR